MRVLFVEIKSIGLIDDRDDSVSRQENLYFDYLCLIHPSPSQSFWFLSTHFRTVFTESVHETSSYLESLMPVPNPHHIPAPVPLTYLYCCFRCGFLFCHQVNAALIHLPFSGIHSEWKRIGSFALGIAQDRAMRE